MNPTSVRALTITSILSFTPALWAQLPPVPTPAGNPTTPDKVNLGKALFWDEQLSSNGTVTCGTCHAPEAGGGDLRAAFATHPGADLVFGTADDVRASPGVVYQTANGAYTPHAVFGFKVQVTDRLAPSAINAAYNIEQFWDGREGGSFADPLTGQVLLPVDASLENQAENPPTSDTEMGHQGQNWQAVANRIASSAPLALASNIPAALNTWIGTRSYPALFQQVYGDPSVTPARIIMAIAAYERTLISDQSPFDLGTLTAQQQQGLAIFGAKARCFLCHHGALFKDDLYHNTGVRPSAEDIGRIKYTGNPVDRGAFKTPGLRNVGLRSAFMHNGGLRSLAEVIDFYDRGGDFFDNLDPLMQPLGLTIAEKAALLDFLANGLTDPRVPAKQAPFDVPSLYTQTSRVPQEFFMGAAGSGGFMPHLIALEPPVLGNARFNLTLAGGLGGAVSALAIDTVQGFGRKTLGVPILVGGSSSLAMIGLPPLQGSGAGQGYWSAAFAIPNDASLEGISLYLQAYSVDAGGPFGFTGTPGMQVTFFRPR